MTDDKRKFHDTTKLRRHGLFHRMNPANFLMGLFAGRKLGSSPAGWFDAPVLDQGDADICSEVGTYTQRAPVTGKAYVPGAFIASEQEFTGDATTTEFDAKAVMATATSAGLLASDGTRDIPDAKLWIYPTGGMDFLDTVNWYVSQYSAPVGVGIPWYSSWETGAGGVIPEGEPQGLVGGHWTTVYPSDRPSFARNKGSWGVSAPGSDQGYYEVPRDVFNEYWQGSGAAIFIKTDSAVVRILNQISDTYVAMIEVLRLE